MTTTPRASHTGYLYDALGRLTGLVDPLAHTTSYSYDTAGRRTAVTDPKGNRTTSTYDAAGRQTATTDPLGNKTTSSYDAAGRRIASVEPRGNVTGANPADYTTRYVYDAAGRLVSEADPFGNTTTYTYDPDGNRLSTTDPRGNAPGADATRYTTRQTFDAAGRLATVVVPEEGTFSFTYDADGRRTAETDPRGAATTYGYDGAGRKVSATDPDGGITSFAYDAANRLVKTVDPRGNVVGASPDDYATSHTYDAAAQLLTVTDPLGNTTRYAYDADGNRVSLTDPRGQLAGADPATYTTRYTRDAAGRLTSVTDPVGNVTSYGYDAAGLRATVTDGFGVTRFAYDAASRLARTDYPDVEAPVPGRTVRVERSYDPAGNLIGLTDPTGTTSLSYDQASRLASAQGPAQSTQYSYDAASNLTRTILPTETFSYTWRADNLLASRVGTGTTSLSYNDAGHRVSLENEARQIDESGRSLGGLATSVRFRTSPTGAPYASWNIEYDPSRRPTRVTDALTGAEQYAYSWDRVGRLAAESYQLPSGRVNVTYQYDAAGNRARRDASSESGPTTYTYDGASRLISKTEPGGATTTYAYDPNGNLTKRVSAEGIALLQWGQENRLLRVTEGAQAVTFKYNGHGRRVTKDVGGTTYRYRYDGEHLEAFLDGTGAALANFAYGRAGAPLSVTIPGKGTYFYHYDAFGSADRLTDSSGVVAIRYAYDAWGNSVEVQEGPAWTPELQDNPFRFRAARGVSFDPTTSIYDLPTGTYEPSVGMISQRDPLDVYQPPSPYKTPCNDESNDSVWIGDRSGLLFFGADFSLSSGSTYVWPQAFGCVRAGFAGADVHAAPLIGTNPVAADIRICFWRDYLTQEPLLCAIPGYTLGLDSPGGGTSGIGFSLAGICVTTSDPYSCTGAVPWGLAMLDEPGNGTVGVRQTLGYFVFLFGERFCILSLDPALCTIEETEVTVAEGDLPQLQGSQVIVGGDPTRPTVVMTIEVATLQQRTVPLDVGRTCLGLACRSG